MELLHKLEAVLFLSFLLPLLLPAQIAQCCLHMALSKISQPQPKEQKACRIQASQSSIRAWGLPVVALVKPVFFVLVWGSLFSNLHQEVRWKFWGSFLLCKRFPACQWAKLPVCQSFFWGTALLKLISFVFVRTDAVHRSISIDSSVLQNLKEVNSKGWDALLGLWRGWELENCKINIKGWAFNSRYITATCIGN